MKHSDPFWRLIVEAADEIGRLSSKCDDAEVRERGAEFQASWSEFRDANSRMLGELFDLSDETGWTGRASIDRLEPYVALAHWCHWIRQFLGPRHALIDSLGFFRQRPEWAETSAKLFMLRRSLETRHGASRDPPSWLVESAAELVADGR